jgi:hypothetical protein
VLLRLRKSGCPQGRSDKTECQVWLLEIRVRCGERKQERADARAPVTVLTYKPGLSFSSGRVRVRLRKPNFGSPSEGHSDQTELKCHFSRYLTIAASESRHSSLGLFLLLKAESLPHCTRLQRRQKPTTVAVSESRHTTRSMGLFSLPQTRNSMPCHKKDCNARKEQYKPAGCKKVDGYGCVLGSWAASFSFLFFYSFFLLSCLLRRAPVRAVEAFLSFL